MVKIAEGGTTNGGAIVSEGPQQANKLDARGSCWQVLKVAAVVSATALFCLALVAASVEALALASALVVLGGGCSLLFALQAIVDGSYKNLAGGLLSAFRSLASALGSSRDVIILAGGTNRRPLAPATQPAHQPVPGNQTGWGGTPVNRPSAPATQPAPQPIPQNQTGWGGGNPVHRSVAPATQPTPQPTPQNQTGWGGGNPVHRPVAPATQPTPQPTPQNQTGWGGTPVNRPSAPATQPPSQPTPQDQPRGRQTGWGQKKSSHR